MTLIGTEDAAKILGVHPSWVRQLIKRGTLPATKVGKTHLIDPKSLRDFKRGRPGRPKNSE